MKRRDFFIVSILVLIGIFCWLNFSAKADSNFENVITINDGNIPTTEAMGWQYTNCVSGDTFIGMRTSTSIIVSPTIDLLDYSSSKINFSARTYYGTTNDSAQISISISEDDGNAWQNIYTHLPTTSTMITSSDFSLDNYVSKKIKIKFQTLSATGYKGTGITNIYILGIKNIIIPTNTPPRAFIHSSSTGYLDDEIEFDGSDSSDDENNISSYYWNFGDSSSSEEIIASHIFPAIGEYLISLTVTDVENESAIATTSINILPKETTTTPTSTTSTFYSFHDIVINEFLSGPTTGNPEWIEFYNNTSSTIDLSGWIVNDGSNKTTTLATSTTLIEPNNFFIIYNIEGNLNNTGDLIILKDSQNNIIDRVAYGIWDDGNISDNAPTTDENHSTARNIDGLSTDNDKINFSITITPTPGQPNIVTPKPSSSGGGNYTAPKQEIPQINLASTTPTTTIEYSDQIIINEILPRPSIEETSNEFIELRNLSTSSIDLMGWILGDNSTNKYTIPSSTIIASSGLIVIKRSSSKIALNNSGVEAVKLYSPNEKLIDLVEYSGPVEKDYSNSRNEKGIFSWTSTPTPGTENIFSSSTSEGDTPDDSNTNSPTTSIKKPTTKTTTIKVTKIITPTQKVSLENISSLALNDKVITQGIVSVEPGILGTQIFYLAGSGIQIYCNKKDFPALKIGDLIEVEGILSEASGERRIKITGPSDIKIIKQGQALEVHQISTSEVGEDMMGSLAKIKGEILEIKGNYIYLDDGSEEAKAYTKPSTGINIKELNLKPGDKLEITGIVSNASGGYRLLPRYITDIIKVGEVKGDFAVATSTENNQSQAWKYFTAIIIFLIIVIIGLIYKFNHSKIKNKKSRS